MEITGTIKKVNNIDGTVAATRQTTGSTNYSPIRWIDGEEVAPLIEPVVREVIEEVGIDSTAVRNQSTVSGTTVTDALNTLKNSTPDNLLTDDILNSSDVDGETATYALNHLNTDISTLSSTVGEHTTEIAGLDGDLQDLTGVVNGNTASINQLNQSLDVLTSSTYSYAECSTPLATVAKVVSIPGITKLVKGLAIRVRFTSTATTKATSGNVSINLNSLGAKNIVDGHSNKGALTYTHTYFYNNMICEFVYDGTNWVYLNRDNNTTYTGATLKTNVDKTGTATTVTDTIAASTTMDNAIGTLLNNDISLNQSLNGLKFAEFNGRLATNTSTVDINLSSDFNASNTYVVSIKAYIQGSWWDYSTTLNTEAKHNISIKNGAIEIYNEISFFYGAEIKILVARI